MANPNLELVCQDSAAFQRRELEVLLDDYLATDVRWQLPGRVMQLEGARGLTEVVSTLPGESATSKAAITGSRARAAATVLCGTLVLVISLAGCSRAPDPGPTTSPIPTSPIPTSAPPSVSPTVSPATTSTSVSPTVSPSVTTAPVQTACGLLSIIATDQELLSIDLVGTPNWTQLTADTSKLVGDVNNALALSTNAVQQSDLQSLQTVAVQEQGYVQQGVSDFMGSDQPYFSSDLNAFAASCGQNAPPS